MTIKVLIAEDHSIVRMAVSILLKQMFPEVSIIESTSFDKMLERLNEQSFELLILDINIPGGNSVQMIDPIRLRQPGIPILIFSSYEEQIYALRYLRAGATGYIHKESDTQELKLAIRKVLRRERYASPEILNQLLNNAVGKNRTEKGITSLTNREIDIMNMLVKGALPSEIKMVLNIQLSTISTYKARIFEKMEVNNLAQLIEQVNNLS
ncbi:MAG: response regulator transcription factor [Agriterribacter sp.]